MIDHCAGVVRIRNPCPERREEGDVLAASVHNAHDKPVLFVEAADQDALHFAIHQFADSHQSPRPPLEAAGLHLLALGIPGGGWFLIAAGPAPAICASRDIAASEYLNRRPGGGRGLGVYLKQETDGLVAHGPTRDDLPGALPAADKPIGPRGTGAPVAIRVTR